MKRGTIKLKQPGSAAIWNVSTTIDALLRINLFQIFKCTTGVKTTFYSNSFQVILMFLWVVILPGVSHATVTANTDSVRTVDTDSLHVQVLANDSVTNTVFDTSSLAIVSQPSTGTAIANSDGTVTYVPVEGESGTYTFDYVICDTTTPAVCDTATVVVEVIPSCPTAFYQVYNGTGVYGVLNVLTPPFVYDSISVLSMATNGSGFNIKDGLVYAATTDAGTGEDSLIAIRPDGTFEVLRGLPDRYNRGDVDTSNNYWGIRTSTEIVKIDLATLTLTVIPFSSGTFASTFDMAFRAADGKFYGVENNGGQMRIFDPVDSSVTTRALSGPITSATGAFGGAWTTVDGALFVSQNSSGVIYEIDVATGVSTNVGTGPAVSANDAASCPLAPAPFAGITSIDDNATISSDSTVVLAVLGNDFPVLTEMDTSTIDTLVGPVNGTVVIDTANGTISYTPNLNFEGVDSFSYVICDTNSPVICDTATVIITVVDPTNLLPIELVSFNGYRQGNNAFLQWTTATEQNNEYFVLLRSIDGLNFKEITRIPGNGDHMHQHTNNYLDPDLHYGTIYYRLKQIDYGGKTWLSKIISVNFDEPANEFLIYPNPNQGMITLQFDREIQAPVSISIFDNLGRLVYENSIIATDNLLDLDLKSLENGYYLIDVSYGPYRNIERIVKQ